MAILRLDPETMAFAERLRSLRGERQLTQARLAELLEVSPRVYNRWKTGVAKPHFDTVVRLVDVLHVSLDELASREEPTSELLVHNHRLHELVRHVDQLPDEDQQTLVDLMDSLIKRHEFRKVLTG